MGSISEVTVDLPHPKTRINRNIYGHFSEHLGKCIYEGLWVGPDSLIPNRNGLRIDVINALKKLHIPVLRWPGGCFADDYHWQDGIGSRDKRPRRINRWWNDIETNEFGTHEFMELCNQIECEPYICGNVGSGTVREMSDWLEYLNCSQDTTLTRERKKNGSPEPFGVRYWGVGNENWGCGGNMSPLYYANEFIRYSTFLSSYNIFPLYKIACGPNGLDTTWTEKFFERLQGRSCGCASRVHMIDGFAFHYYYNTGRFATEFNDDQYYALILKAIGMEEHISEHRAIMDKYDPGRRIGLICDEWGIWHKADPGTNPHWLFQQNTLCDAIITALTFDIFNNNADKIVMANIAQTVNVIQSMVLTQKEKMTITPTYHVFEMYKGHQDAILLPTEVKTEDFSQFSLPRISASASKQDNKMCITLTNLDPNADTEIRLNFKGNMQPVMKSWRCLTSSDLHDHNTFKQQEKLIPVEKKLPGNQFALPAKSVNQISYDLA